MKKPLYFISTTKWQASSMKNIIPSWIGFNVKCFLYNLYKIGALFKCRFKYFSLLKFLKQHSRTWQNFKFFIFFYFPIWFLPKKPGWENLNLAKYRSDMLQPRFAPFISGTEFSRVPQTFYRSERFKHRWPLSKNRINIQTNCTNVIISELFVISSSRLESIIRTIMAFGQIHFSLTS